MHKLHWNRFYWFSTFISHIIPIDSVKKLVTLYRWKIQYLLKWKQLHYRYLLLEKNVAVAGSWVLAKSISTFTRLSCNWWKCFSLFFFKGPFRHLESSYITRSSTNLASKLISVYCHHSNSILLGIHLIFSFVTALRFIAQPKSVIRTCPLASRRIFPQFKSLCKVSHSSFNWRTP